MKVLIAHRSFPGQFRWLLEPLMKKGFEIVFLCKEKTDWPRYNITVIEAVSKNRQNSPRVVSNIGYEYEEEFVETAIALLNKGFNPDVIIAHSGWGVWRCADIFRPCKKILYCEWWFTKKNLKYHTLVDQNINLEVTTRLNNSAVRNAIATYDLCISPTIHQRSQFPSELREKIKIISDGFPLDYFSPQQIINTTEGLNDVLKLIYVSRGREFTRGFDRLCELINRLDESRCKYQCTIIADKRKIYDHDDTHALMHGETWKGLKTSPNLKFFDQKSYDEYKIELERADIHLYLSRPFVLSWSFIESCLLGSRICSLNNPSTLEVSCPNHIDFDNMNNLVSFIQQSAKPAAIKVLRNQKYNWLKTGYAQLFRTQHSVELQFQSLMKYFNVNE